MTFENALKKIKEKFADVEASKLADMAVQVTLTDEDCGGTLYFKAADGTVDVQGYDYRDNDAVIDIERKAFMDILSGKLTLDKAVNKGKATVKGNFEKLDTLKDAIPAYVAPAKKEAAPAEKETTVEKKAAPAKAAAPSKTAAPAKTAAPVEKKAPAAKKTATKKATVKKTTATKKTTVK